jgi:hypothetical protein
VEVFSDTASTTEAIVPVAWVQEDCMLCVNEVLNVTILMASSLECFPDYQLWRRYLCPVFFISVATELGRAVAQWLRH